jgi:hypothetical protein
LFRSLLSNRASLLQRFLCRLALRMFLRTSTACLMWVGASDMPFKMVSCVPTTDQPSKDDPGSMPTTNCCSDGLSTALCNMMQNIPNLFQYALAFFWVKSNLANTGLTGINGFLFVSNTGTNIVFYSTRLNRGNISLRSCKVGLVRFGHRLWRSQERYVLGKYTNVLLAHNAAAILLAS